MSTTSSLLPEPHAALPDTGMGSADSLDRMVADVQTMQQQALATQKTLEQLQAREAAGFDGVFSTQLPLAEGVWGLAAVVLAFALARAWQQRRWRTVAAVESEGDSVPHPQTTAQKVAPPVNVPPVEPEFADASDSDWGVSHSVELEEPAGFDVDAAASEVARVRNALAQRRQARALERAEDARRARALTEQARRRAEEFPTWEDSKPFPETLDVASDDAVAPVSIPSAPVPFWHRPMLQDVQAESPEEPESGSSKLDDAGETLPSLDDVYAVKLALAKESVAVDLWIEARELIREVLESGDPELQAQAHALMATMERRKDKSRLGL